MGGDPEEDPGHAGVAMSLGWDPPRRARGSLGVPALAAAPVTGPQISRRKWMDEWMDG